MAKTVFGHEMRRRHRIPSAVCNYGCRRSLVRTCVRGNVSHSWRDFHVKIPSCLTPCAKENRVLGQGNLTAERNESMNEPTVAPIMGMNAYWSCLWVGELEMGTGHSPALQLAVVDSVSK